MHYQDCVLCHFYHLWCPLIVGVNCEEKSEKETQASVCQFYNIISPCLRQVFCQLRWYGHLLRMNKLSLSIIGGADDINLLLVFIFLDLPLDVVKIISLKEGRVLVSQDHSHLSI